MNPRSMLDGVLEISNIMLNDMDQTLSLSAYSQMLHDLKTASGKIPDYRQDEVREQLGLIYMCRATKFEDERYLQNALEDYQMALNFLSEKEEVARKFCEERINKIPPGQKHMPLQFTGAPAKGKDIVKPAAERMEEKVKKILNQLGLDRKDEKKTLKNQ